MSFVFKMLFILKSVCKLVKSLVLINVCLRDSLTGVGGTLTSL